MRRDLRRPRLIRACARSFRPRVYTQPMSHSEHQAIEALALQTLASLGRSQDERSLNEHAVQSDYYTLLGISQHAEEHEVREALERLATQDLSVGVRAALHNAARVLLHADLRAQYNASL